MVIMTANKTVNNDDGYNNKHYNYDTNKRKQNNS